MSGTIERASLSIGTPRNYSASSSMISDSKKEMETKREIFRERYPSRKFPEYQVVDIAQYSRILFGLAKNFQIKEYSNILELNNEILKSGTIVQLPINESKFKIHEFVPKDLVTENIYLFLGFPGQFLLFNSRDFERNFDDIYYPGYDDIIIISSNCDWVIFIDHEGDIIPSIRS